MEPEKEQPNKINIQNKVKQNTKLYRMWGMQM